MFLREVVEFKRFEVANKKEKFPLDSFKHRLPQSDRNFKKAIHGKEKISLIAEIKKASPSEGLLKVQCGITEIAGIYCKYAQAISIVTDNRYFQGSDTMVTQARNACKLPILRKDFIIDDYQIFESRFLEADAILLIAAILEEEKIHEFISTARSLAMDCLVEVHDEEELRKAIAAGAEIIGVNNRDLNTFELDLSVARELLPKIPADKVSVVESGLHSKADIEQFARRADAVLIGTALIKADNLEEKLKELTE